MLTALFIYQIIYSDCIAEVVDVRPVGIHEHQTLVEHQQTTLTTVCDNFVVCSYVNLQQLDSQLGKTATHFVLLTYCTFYLT